MTVISDTSPLRYLALIDRLELLPQLFGHVWCPAKVRDECCHPRAPKILSAFFGSSPEWLHIIDDPPVPHAQTTALDSGEAAAITLANQHEGCLLLMDERKGRRVAENLGLRVAGTINIIAEAAVKGVLDYHQTVSDLRMRTNFHIHDDVVATAWEQAQ